MNQATPDPARIARDLTASQKRILLYMHPQDTASFVGGLFWGVVLTVWGVLG